jgi:hypothetical protein
MNKEQISRWTMLFFAIMCLITLILVSLSVIPVSKLLGQDKIITHINWYLNESHKVERQDLIVLLEIETLLSPMQHSDIGISSNIDAKVGVGEILASLNRLISDTAKVYIFAISTIEIMKYIIIISETIMPLLFTGVLFAGVIFGLCHSFSDSYGLHTVLCNQITEILFVLFFVLHILLPYSLFASALLSENIIKKDRTENRAMLHNLNNQIKSTHTKENFSKRAEKMINSLEKTVLNLPHKIELMAMHHTKHLAMSILEFMILPILLFLISIGILRWTMKIDIPKR